MQSQAMPKRIKFALGPEFRVKVKSRPERERSCPYNAMYVWLQKIPGDTLFRRTCIEHTPMRERKEKNRIKATGERKIISTGLDSVSRYKGST